MNLHEYQSKQLFAEYDIPVPQGIPAHTPDDAARAAREIGGSVWVVKAQVHAGGRGKAGGVKLVDSPEAANEAAQAMLGSTIVTHQTGPEGLPVNTVLVEAGSRIARELYLILLVDRAKEQVVFMASAAGGMDIEEVAATEPEKIFTVAVHPAAGSGLKSGPTALGKGQMAYPGSGVRRILPVLRTFPATASCRLWEVR